MTDETYFVVRLVTIQSAFLVVGNNMLCTIERKHLTQLLRKTVLAHTCKVWSSLCFIGGRRPGLESQLCREG